MMLVVFIEIIRGRIKVISTSKIRKITAIKKNWREKGIRAEDLGSNPHSKGDLFSRSENVFFDKIVAKIIIILAIMKVIVAIVTEMNIIYASNLDLLIGS